MPSVLVVDDEPDIRELLRVNLEAAGHEVTLAASGDEALVALDRMRPDAIFLDILMPGTDGWSVLEQLKAKDDALSTVPIVMISALSGTEQRLRGAIEGAVRYLTKPFDARTLLTALAEVLDPNAPPEIEQRRQARQSALETIARIEARGSDSVDVGASTEPRVHLTRLERAPVEPLPPLQVSTARERMASLTTKQRELLELLANTSSVAVAAERLDTSRSNVYASLRRIVHRLGLRDTSELLRLLHDGELVAQSDIA